MRWRSAISPTACAADPPSCSPGRGRNGCCRAPNGWNCSSCWPSAASTRARRTASSAGRPGRRCAVSRPRSGRRRTDLPPPTSWNGCGGAKSPLFHPKSNPENHDFAEALTVRPEPRFYGENLPACGPIPLLYLTHHDPLRPSRMRKPKSFLRVFTDTGPLAVLAVVIAFLVGIVGPASAQFFNFGGFGGPPQRQAPQRGGGWFGGDFFQPFQQQAPQAPRQDFSRAPGPAKRDTVPERNVLVLGDAMADWLAYGLEDAYAE